MDLCKVQVNAPPSLEIPVKFFARYCAYTSVNVSQINVCSPD
jgi:hypothetical protein